MITDNTYLMLQEMRILQKRYALGERNSSIIIRLELVEGIIDDAIHQHFSSLEQEREEIKKSKIKK